MEEKLIKIASNILGYDIDINDNLKESGMDSLSIVTLIVDIEEEFNITFNDSDLEPSNLTTLNDIKKVMEKYLWNYGII